MKDFTVFNLSQYDRFKAANLTKPEQNRAAHFIQGLLKESYNFNYSTNDYLPRAVNWFVSVYGSIGKQKKFLHKLISVGLVQENSNYSWLPAERGRGTCKSFRINPELKSELFEIVYFDNKYDAKPGTDLKESTHPNCVYQRQIIRELRTTLSKKEIKKGLRGVLGEIVTEDYVLSRININNQITKSSIEVNGYFFNTEKFIEDAKYKGRFVYESNKRFYTRPNSEFKDFIQELRQTVCAAYVNQILKIKDRKAIAQLDQTNGRVYTNYTHLAGKRETAKATYPALIDFFTISGEALHTLDLQHSQVTLAFWLMLKECNNTIKQLEDGKAPFEIPFKWVGEYSKARNEKELLRYAYRLASQIECLMESDADFYETIRLKLQENSNSQITRSRAKRIVFEIIFSSHRNYSKGKKILKEAFPEFVAFIDCYKKRAIHYFTELEKSNPQKFSEILESRRRNRDRLGKITDATSLGNAAFVVELQKIETSIFIDTISPELKRLRIKYLTKHDSITVPESALEQTRQVMKRILDKIIGKNRYKLRHEKPTKNILKNLKFVAAK